MREIKFRAWDKKEFTMLKEFTPEDFFSTSGLINHSYHNCVFMQYTGLKDKNGVEIYESDYLGDWCVFWASGKYILQNISTGDIIDCNQITTYDKEITGNKYETPREHKAMETDL